jgi:hypothetical protein
MPHLTRTLTVEGALIEVLVGIASTQARALLAAGQPIPPPQTLFALLDTGASQSAIDLQLVSTLGLPRIGQATLATPSTSITGQSFTLYEVNLTLLHPQASLTLANHRVAAAPLSYQGLEVILGRDILQKCLLVYDGQAGTFTLAF